MVPMDYKKRGAAPRQRIWPSAPRIPGSCPDSGKIAGRKSLLCLPSIQSPIAWDPDRFFAWLRFVLVGPVGKPRWAAGNPVRFWSEYPVSFGFLRSRSGIPWQKPFPYVLCRDECQIRSPGSIAASMFRSKIPGHPPYRQSNEKCSSWDICFPTDVRYGNNLVGLPGHQIQQAGFYLCFLLCSGPLYSKALSKKPRSTNILLMISKANSFISIIQGKRSFINKNKEIWKLWL